MGIPIFFYTKGFRQGESLQLNPGRSFSLRDREYAYESPNDPSAGGTPLWMNVLTGIAPVYRPDGTLDPTHVYVADEQGPDDYQTDPSSPIYHYGYDETDPDLTGYVWKLDLTTGSAQAIFPTAPTLYRTQDITVDASNGNIIVLGFAGYDTSGINYTDAGLQPVIGVYNPTSYQLLHQYILQSTDIRRGTDLVQPVPNAPGSFYLGVGGGNDKGDIYRFDAFPGTTLILTGTTTTLIPSYRGLGNLTAMVVYCLLNVCHFSLANL